MSRQIKHFITPAEYLELERRSEYKDEYLNGDIFAMTGASRAHNLITGNITAAFIGQLRGRQCESYSVDMSVKVAKVGLYTYPDVVVVCGEPQFEDAFVDTLLNPTVLIEVLSMSTVRYDRIAKSSYYRTLDSPAVHLLVSQDRYRVEQYERHSEGQWNLREYWSLEDVVELSSIGCTLALSDVYDKISIDPNARVEPR